VFSLESWYWDREGLKKGFWDEGQRSRRKGRVCLYDAHHHTLSLALTLTRGDNTVSKEILSNSVNSLISEAKVRPVKRSQLLRRRVRRVRVR
jgi:hypothetical protein